MPTDPSRPRRRQLRQPRLADVIADALRERILAGEIADGDLLPKQEQLIEDFGVSMPSIREALRVLETEGLIVVQRGNVGGATVHLPRPANVAYMLALVLQSRTVELDDVAVALGALEPQCAAMAARRNDRGTTVVPLLRARITEARALEGDHPAFVRSARAFHEDLVAACANETMIVLCGALESLWSAHVHRLSGSAPGVATGPGAFDTPEFRASSLADHAALVDAIEAGDAPLAERLAAAHFSQPERHDFIAQHATVQARLLR